MFTVLKRNLYVVQSKVKSVRKPAHNWSNTQLHTQVHCLNTHAKKSIKPPQVVRTSPSKLMNLLASQRVHGYSVGIGWNDHQMVVIMAVAMYVVRGIFGHEISPKSTLLKPYTNSLILTISNVHKAIWTKCYHKVYQNTLGHFPLIQLSVLTSLIIRHTVLTYAYPLPPFILVISRV